MNLVTAEGLGVRLGARDVLLDVDFRISSGEIVTIIGPNGSGKSTLIRAMVGAIPIFAGEITKAPGLRIGYMPQRLHLDAAFPLTVSRFLHLPVRRSNAEAADALARVDASALLHQQMATLSGGQFQRVLLARALLNKPDLLMLDEPTQGLDQPAIASFYELIADLRAADGCAVLMISHELHVVMRASDRVVCLNGHVCCEGTPATVSLDPQYRALFGDAGQALALYRHQHDHTHDHHGAESAG